MLESFADSFRILWISDQVGWLAPSETLALHDLDRDGIHEISFVTASFGTGGGIEILWLYAPGREKKLLSAAYHHDWQNWHASPRPALELNETDKDSIAILELAAAQKFATSRIATPPDLDDPRYAVLRWHKENGPLTDGKVSIHEYCDEPIFGASITDQIEEGEFRYTAYFKGPVYCYDRNRNRNFVVWSPAWIYHWPTCLLFVKGFLFIGTRGQGILRFDGKHAHLRRFVEFGSERFEEVYTLKHAVDPEFVDIDDRLLISITYFTTDTSGTRA